MARAPASGLDVELADLDPAARWREWLARIEAVLFASADPVPRARLGAIVGRDAVLDDLIGDLRADLAGRPCEIVAIGDGWRMQTRPAYAPVIRAAACLPPEGPELREFDLAVLAAIATRQPVTRTQLAEYFGRRIDVEAIGRLKAHDVIADGPRRPTPGAARTLVTSEGFLAMFGMRSLAELGEESEEKGGGEDGLTC